MTPETTRSDGGDGKAQQVAQQAVDRAQEAVGDATDSAKGAAKTQLDQRSTQVGEQVGMTADALRSTGDHLRQQGNQAVADMTDQAARQAQKLGSYLEQADADQLLADVERYARRNPWAVVVGGVLVGAAAARFLKASSSQRYQQGREQSRQAAWTAGPTASAEPTSRDLGGAYAADAGYAGDPGYAGARSGSV
jgi:hypothetical protein